MNRFKSILKHLFVLILVWELCLPALPVYSAEITVDTSVPVNQRPALDRAQNGVTIINLARPTSGGVSHNRFEDYNVNRSGVILNNSRDMGVSVLGGAIYGNPNYQGSGMEAGLVINEVTGVRRSNIFGYTEMFGKSAEFILVNPNGILLNGAGFINMPRVTLGTGVAEFDNGEFRGITIPGGSITVEGEGIDAGKVNYFEILSRAVTLNGSIWGRDVSINTGTGYYDYNSMMFNQSELQEGKPEFSIDASLLGSIYAGRIRLVSNEKGVGVRSNSDMLADVSDIMIRADGSIELKNAHAAGNIDAESGSAGIYQYGNAFAMGGINYSGSGITNRGTVESPGDITMTGYVDNDSGIIRGGGDIDLFTGGTLRNINGLIAASGESSSINIRGEGGLFLSGGEIKSAGGISISAEGDIIFDDTTGTVYADKYFNLTSANFINNIILSMNGAIGINTRGFIVVNDGGGIISNNGVSLVSGGKVINSGIISGDSVNIRASMLENNQDSEISGGYGSSLIDIGGNIDNRGRISGATDLSVMGERISNYSIDSEISAGGNLEIEADSIVNMGGLIFSGNDMDMRFRYISNNRGFIYSSGNMGISRDGITGSSLINYSGYIESEGDMFIDLGPDGRLENTGEDTGSYTSKLVTVGDYTWNEYSPMQRWELTSTMETESSFLKSGGDMTIAAEEVKNHGSVISAGNDMTINAETLINETESNYVHLSQYELRGKKVRKEKRIGTKWIGFTWKKWTEYYKKWYNGTVSVESGDKGIIHAGGEVVINAGSVFNGNSADYDSLKKYDNREEIISAGSVQEQLPGVERTGVVTHALSIDDISGIGTIDLSRYIRLDENGNALFNVNIDPGTTYLVETRLSFTDVNKLKGSQYLLDRIGYDPEASVKFLGDAYYEQRLVSEAVLKSTSRKYLAEGLSSEQEQMEWLLENAASAYTDLELAVGVALTKDQINELQQPIVWYVKETIMGVEVLSPKIYIPEHIIAGFTSNSSSIAGNTVTINATGDVTNSGLIHGDTGVEIRGADITNHTQGKRQAQISGGDVILTAENSIVNRGGLIRGENGVSLTAENGDIINETEVFTREYDHTSPTLYALLARFGVGNKPKEPDGDIKSTLGTTASIESGGNLRIDAGGNFTNSGAEVKADGDAEIAALGNIDFETVHLRDKTVYSGSGKKGVDDKTGTVGSSLEIGGDLKLTSGRDINFIGSSADIAGNAEVEADGNFNLINDYDTSYYEMKTTKDGFLSSTTTHVVKSSQTVAGSNFTTGGDLKVEAGNDINIVGSEVSSGGSADVAASGDINITAVHDEEYYKRTRTSKGFGVGGSLYGSDKKMDMEYDKTAVGSTVDIKERYASSSGKDTNIRGSSITAGEAEITTGGDLNITAAYSEHAEAHHREISGVGMGGNIYAMEIDMEGHGSTTASGASITAGNLILNSGNDILVEGSIINAGRAEITAEKDIIVTSAEETGYEYSVHEKTTVGLNLKILVNPYAALDYKDGRLSVKLGSAEYNNKTEKTENITQSSSELNIGNGLTIDSGNDIIVAGSNIEAGGDVSLTAINNVSIETTEESTKTEIEEISGKAEVTVGIKNAATDVAYATKALADAKKALEQAKDDYDKYKDNLKKARDDLDKGLIDKDEYESLKSDEKYYIANIALCTENLVAKTAALVSATASAAATAGTYGFSADIQLQIDGSYEKTRTEDIMSKGSNIKAGGNFTVTAGNKAMIEGSDVSAGSDIILDAKSVDILAAKNTSTSSTKSGEISTTISIGTASVGGPSISGSASLTESGSNSTTYSNSHLSGSNITIKSTEDTTVLGGVVAADNALTVNVSGNLTVESLQDSSKNHSNTAGISGGTNSAGVNANISSGNKKWITEQTSLTGGTVDIYVENKTTLTGAVIASVSGDLSLDTGSFEYSHINDKDYSSNLGGGVNVGTDSKSVNVTYGFTDKRQTNFATIGEGTITVRDASTGSATGLEGLNRDVSISQYNTKDGGLQGGFTVDTATVNLVVNSVDTVTKTLVAIADGYKDAKETTGILYNKAGVVIEKTGNLIEYGHFTTDDKVDTYLSMDEYERRVESGKSVSAQDKLNYYGSKDFLGEPLSPEEQVDMVNAFAARKIEISNELKQDILDTWKDSTALIVNNKLAVLRELDPVAAVEIDAMFAGIRAGEKQRQYIEDTITRINPSLEYDNKTISEIQKIIKENAVICIQTQDKIENQYYIITKNDGIQLNGKGEYGKAVYTVNTGTIEYVKEEESMLSSVKREKSSSGQAIYKADYTGSDSVYGGVNTKGAVIGVSRSSANLSSNGSHAYTSNDLTVTGKGAVAGTAVVAVTVVTTVIIKNPSAAAEIATGLIPKAIPVVTPVLQMVK